MVLAGLQSRGMQKITFNPKLSKLPAYIKYKNNFHHLHSMILNKKGQFFLIAALIIIGILISLRVVYNVAQGPPEDTQTYDLSEEIKFEGAQVIDNGIFTAKDQTEINSKVEFLTNHYFELGTQDDLIIVVGDEREANIIYYTHKTTGFVGIGLGSQPITLTQTEQTKLTATESVSPGTPIELTFQGQNLGTFNIKKGQTFYLVLKKEKNGEQIVATN